MIPILGQPRVLDWLLVLHVSCPCGTTFLLQPGLVRACTGCEKVYRLAGVPTIDAEGRIHAPLDVGTHTVRS